MFGFRSIFAKASGYDAATHSIKRESVPVEKTGEDGILRAKGRSILVAAQRDAFRNTTFAPATALQLQIGVVGNEGGKLTFTTADKTFNAEAGREFRRWSRNFNFTDGSSLNETLQLLLIQLTHNGGDFIAVFDDGCLTGGYGSGKVRIFEADEIKNITDEEFARIYGKGFTQSNGIVYDSFGRICGAFVSTVARGAEVFAAGQFINLRLDTPADFSSSNWVFVANRWRPNQGRGISTATHVTNLLQDIAETQSSEIQAAKLNSGLGLVITDGADSSTAEADVAKGWEDPTDASGVDLSPQALAEYEAAQAAENAALRKAADNLKAGSSAILKLDGSKKIDSFSTERPNLNTVQFIRDQRNEAGTVYGLPSTYTTLEPAGSYTAFRGSMVLAERAFARLRKKLERDFLDWCAIRFVRWYGFKAPDGYEFDLFWRWPAMPEVDEGAAQKAIEKAIQNGTESLTSLLGPERVAKVIEQQGEEKKAFEEAGLVYPASKSVNGTVVTTPNEEEGQNEG